MRADRERLEVGMRNAIIHGYFSVNWNRVWTVIENDIEPLRAAVVNLLDRIGTTSAGA